MRVAPQLATNPHLAQPVVRLGAPLASARVVVVLVHGRGQSPAVMHDLVVRRLDLPRVAYVAPAAAHGSWYPAGFMAPWEANEPDLTHARARLGALGDELAAEGIAHEAQVVMGFSQGACLACDHVLARPRPPAALVAFTGGLIGPAGTTWAPPPGAGGPRLRGVPVLVGGSRRDPWVPAARMDETAAVFARLGARVETRFHDAAVHVVSDEEIAAARALLEELGA